MVFCIFEYDCSYAHNRSIYLIALYLHHTYLVDLQSILLLSPYAGMIFNMFFALFPLYVHQTQRHQNNYSVLGTIEMSGSSKHMKINVSYNLGWCERATDPIRVAGRNESPVTQVW